LNCNCISPFLLPSPLVSVETIIPRQNRAVARYATMLYEPLFFCLFLGERCSDYEQVRGRIVTLISINNCKSVLNDKLCRDILFNEAQCCLFTLSKVRKTYPVALLPATKTDSISLIIRRLIISSTSRTRISLTFER